MLISEAVERNFDLMFRNWKRFAGCSSPDRPGFELFTKWFTANTWF